MTSVQSDKEKIDFARKRISILCKKNDWRMSIPVQETDDDMLFSWLCDRLEAKDLEWQIRTQRFVNVATKVIYSMDVEKHAALKDIIAEFTSGQPAKGVMDADQACADFYGVTLKEDGRGCVPHNDESHRKLTIWIQDRQVWKLGYETALKRIGKDGGK